MKCRVVCASLGYGGRVYKEGEDVAVSTPAEVKRLIGYRVIMAGEEEIVPENEEVGEVANPPETFYNQKKQTGGRKKK